MLKNTFQACKTCPNHPINVQKRPPFVFPYYVKTFQNQPLNVRNSLFLVFPTIKGKPKGGISVIYRLILTCFTCLKRVFRQKTHFGHVKHVKISLKMAEIPPFGFPFYTRENQKEAFSDIYRLILKCFNLLRKTKRGFFWTFIGRF